VASAARAIEGPLLAPGQQTLEAATGLGKTDPLGAFLLVEKVPVVYKGTPVGAQAANLVSRLKVHPAVEAELRARTVLQQIRKLDGALSAQAGNFNPADPTFRTKNSAALNQLRATLEQMRKKHPKAKATQEAEKICKAYGID
jgi:hypothetical protein